MNADYCYEKLIVLRSIGNRKHQLVLICADNVFDIQGSSEILTGIPLR